MLLMRLLCDVEIKFLEWIYIIPLLLVPLEHHLANGVHISKLCTLNISSAAEPTIIRYRVGYFILIRSTPIFAVAEEEYIDGGKELRCTF